MMAYAAITDLQQRIGSSIYDELYPDPEPAESDLEAAAAEINGAISFRYALPVTGQASLALLRDWNLTLAEERAFARPAGADFTEKVKSRVALVRQYLTMIREDTFRLPDAALAASGSGSAGIALVQCDPPVFSRDRMKGF